MKGRRKTKDFSGVNEAGADIKDKPERRNNAGKIFNEAEKRKRGGKVVEKMAGDKAKFNAGRKPRKSGGSCENSPFSSARSGSAPKGHTTEQEIG